MFISNKIIDAISPEMKEIKARLINTESKLNMVLGIEERPYPGHPNQAFGHYTYSQHGEDLIFAQIFTRLGIEKPSYLDIGAHHPLEISNTALLYKRGARGVNIEANPLLIRNFEVVRTEDKNVNVGVGPERGIMPFYCVDEQSGRNTFDKEAMDAFLEAHPQFEIKKIIQVEVITINDAVERYCENVWPDLLSVDIEGLDYAVLSSADFSKSEPKIICVEITTPDGTLGELPRMRQLLRGKGFEPYALAHGNAIFLNAETRKNLQFFD